MFHSKTLRTTLWIVLISMMVPVLAMGTYAFRYTTVSAQESLQAERVKQLTLLSKSSDAMLAQCDAIYYQLLLDNVTRRAINLQGVRLPIPYEHLRRMNALLNNMNMITSAHPFLQSLSIYEENEHGLLFSSRHGLVRLATEPDRGWHDAYLSHEGELWHYLVRDLQGFGPVLSVLMPFAPLLYNRQGVMVFNILGSSLTAMLPPEDENATWMVLGPSGDLFVQSPNAPPLTQDLRARVLGMATGDVAKTHINEEETLLFTTHSEQTGWIFVNFTPQALLLRTAHGLRRMLMFIGSASLIAGVLIAVFLTRIATRPMRRLLDVIRRMNQGETLAMPKGVPDDEFSLIAYNLLGQYVARQGLREELAQREIRQRDAELVALQAQINPHFLYNTMEMVNWLAIRELGGKNEISHIITSLSDLLRYAIENPGERVPLAREVEHAKVYVELMRLRLGPLFEIDWQIAPAVLNYPTHKLTLQPLLENAIQHGIQEKCAEMGVAGHIWIQCHMEEGFFNLAVTDDGAGIPPEKLQELREQLASFDGLQFAHIGLFNVYQRIRLISGDRATLTIGSVEGQGTRVNLRFPMDIDEGGNQG